MRLGLLHSITIIVVCTLVFLLTQAFLLRKFSNEKNIIFSQYIIFTLSLLFFLGDDKISKNTLLIVILPILLLVISMVISIYLEKEKNDVDVVESILKVCKSVIGKYYVYVVLAPVLEELFFRAFIIGNILSDESIFNRLIISTTIFAISHLKPKAVIESFIGGLILSMTYIYTNNIFLVICIHISYNSLCISIKSK